MTYIEREALIKKMRTMPIPEKAGSGNTWLDNCGLGVNAAIQEVESFPAADVVQVVRCRECKHLYRSICAVCGFLPRKPGDYCSRGERKDG